MTCERNSGVRPRRGRRPRHGPGAVLLVLLALLPLASACAPPGGERGAAPGPSGGTAPPGGIEIGGVPQRISPPPRPPEGTGAGPPVTPRPKAPPTPGAPASAAPTGPVYIAWAGPGCSGGGGYREDGRYGDGAEGWYTVGAGGHRGDGCDGSFTAMPMSGEAGLDGGGSATWSWYVGSGYRTCTVAVVVPAGERARDAAGSPSVYHVLSDPDDPASVERSFDIDQVALRGQGVVVERVPVHDQRLTLRLLDRGRGRGLAHHGAAQIRAECRP
ncbi:adhesin [Streptomyces sp. NPDC048001]|uniref:adhesin n=1 Tax=Streptomyces sp. NPDC048001 TaxID=3365498 RepID=UPI0037125459